MGDVHMRVRDYHVLDVCKLGNFIDDTIGIDYEISDVDSKGTGCMSIEVSFEEDKLIKAYINAFGLEIKNAS